MRTTTRIPVAPIAISALTLVLTGLVGPATVGTAVPAAASAAPSSAHPGQAGSTGRQASKNADTKADKKSKQADKKADKNDKKADLELVVGFRNPAVYGPGRLEAEYQVEHVAAALPSRGIHMFRSTAASVKDQRKLAKLAKQIESSEHVAFAEADSAAALTDSRYHSWPSGAPEDAGTDRSRFGQQPLVRRLALAQSHRVSTGDGVTVAVLDTGSWNHPDLTTRLVGGYDYVDDDTDPTEERQELDGNNNKVVDEAYGHGTFVAGLVSLVAPGASIMPMRVLDSDGGGSVFLVAQAIVDAVDDGADVVNVSLGSPEKIKSKFLDAALDYAQLRGVRVVAAAGNAGTSDAQYPATEDGVLSVTSTLLEQDQLAKHANYGHWVDVAAPGEDLVGPVPGQGYAEWAGTSMAAPQVSGQLALLIQASGTNHIDDQDPVIESVVSTTRPVTGRPVQHGAVDLPASLRKATGRSDAGSRD